MKINKASKDHQLMTTLNIVQRLWKHIINLTLKKCMIMYPQMILKLLVIMTFITRDKTC